MSWTLNKLDPTKTIYFKGFSGINCPAAINNASSSGFTLSQKFTSNEDFSDLVAWDNNDYFKGPSWLPNSSLRGMVWTFDITADPTVFATLDSTRFPTIDFPFLDCIRTNGTSVRIDLSWANIQTTVNPSLLTAAIPVKPNNNATSVVSGSHSTARATITVNSSGGSYGDYMTLWYRNYAYQYLLTGSDDGSYIASQLVQRINDSNTDIVAVYHAGSPSFDVYYRYPGAEGNSAGLYWTTSNPGGTSFSPSSPIMLSGGSSNVTFRCTVDFTALGIDDLRQAVLTFAPAKPYGVNLNTSVGVYGDVVFSNWSVSDPFGNSKLYVRGPGTVRVEESSPWVTTNGSWVSNSDGFFSDGFSIKSNTPGDSASVNYFCQYTHDLYIGTWLYASACVVDVSIDDAAPISINLGIANYPSADAPVSGVVKVLGGMAPGEHVVNIVLVSGTCYFDFLEAVVPVISVTPMGPFPDRGVSTDLDTQHGYQLPPARLASIIEYLGLTGDVDHYEGVFWWNNRTLVGRNLGYVTIDFSTFSVTDSLTAGVFLEIGGETIGKSYIYGEPYVPSTAALHFSLFINETFAGLVASASGSVLTITSRASSQSNSAYNFTFNAYYTQTGLINYPISYSGPGFIYVPGGGISDGKYYIDPTQPAINYPMGLWTLDYFKHLKALNINVSAAFSMELVYPPDANTIGSVWVQRSNGGIPIETATGFGSYISSQCAPMASSFLAFQKAAYLALAQIMVSAGIRPYIQFGEFLWWFFSSFWRQPIGYLAVLSYVRLGFAAPHGLVAGNIINVQNCGSVPSVNGTWEVVAVPDATHIDINAPYGGGTWTGDGIVSGGSMAFYDAETTLAASTALGRPLTTFTFPTDYPGVNGYSDAGFLASRLAQHLYQLVGYLQSQVPGLITEILWPGDVNSKSVYPVSQVGGQLNAYVNLPASWQSSATAPFNIFKLEQLAAMTTDRNCNLVRQGLEFLQTLNWPTGSIRYLYPVDGPSVAQWREYRIAKAYRFPNYNPFAIDQICLYNWPVAVPEDPTAQIS